jgi:pimeloyl-ACP methyl ester carboxylesterase
MKQTVATALAAALAAAAAGEALARRRTARAEITRYVDVGGHRVAVSERGARPDPDTPAVMVVPGAGDCQESWTAVADRLADRTLVITYDRAGLGASERGPAPTATRYVAELQAVLDACTPQGQYVLVGHSLGGLVARLHAQEHPERLAGLVQVDATPEAVAEDRGVRVGFAVSGVLTSALKVLAPVGLVRLLRALRASRSTRSSEPSRPSWTRVVGVPGSTRSTVTWGPAAPPAASSAPCCPVPARRSGAPPMSCSRSSVTCRWSSSAATPGEATGGWTCTGSSPPVHARARTG